jgi:hypothetical protein
VSPLRGTSPAEPSPWEWGLEGVFLEDSAGLGLWDVSAAFGLGVALVEEDI